MNDKTNAYRADIVSEWRNVLKTPANLHLLSTQLSVLCAMAEEDAIAERDALREKVDMLRGACDNVAGNMERTTLWSDWHNQVATSILRNAYNATA